MFFFGRKMNARERQRAENLLVSAEKVIRYRDDIFDEAEHTRLSDAVAALKTALENAKKHAENPDIPENSERKSGESTVPATESDSVPAASAKEPIAAASDALEKILTELGGTIFPHRKIPEWVELIVVAAILAGGIRAFFIQPFKIPTNSMFPTYNGMTSELCDDSENAATRLFERIFRSASFFSFPSPAAGEVLIPLGFDAAKQRYFLLRPEKNAATGNIVDPSKDIYKLCVGGNAVPVTVPRDFSLSSVLLKAFFPEFEKIAAPELLRWQEIFKTAKIARLPDGTPALRTGKHVAAGENVLNFKILGGDMVLVDRATGHFVAPERGDPFVFRTRNIPGLNNVELYYIKRLAGMPGDVLRTENGKLLVNGVPADFAEAFRLNNAPTPEKKYYGYFPTSGAPSPYSWPLSKDFRVPDGFFYALGDNSANSYDSRGWGGVPADDVVGTARFILYPFSRRWGLAK